jgi:hypothetical protein
MARTKKPAIQRAPSETYFHHSNGKLDSQSEVPVINVAADAFVKDLHAKPLHKEAGLLELLFCVGGIYASLYVPFLSLCELR